MLILCIGVFFSYWLLLYFNLERINKIDDASLELRHATVSPEPPVASVPARAHTPTYCTHTAKPIHPLTQRTHNLRNMIHC